MLKLAEATRPDWVKEALEHLGEIMLDHAHCEKKAAGAALRLLFSYPDQRFLQEPLAALAREELAHFQQVLALMDARGIEYRSQRPSPYAGRLHSCVRQQDPHRLVDLLLICALIEARSCERLKLLSESVADTELADFFKALLAAEARHHQLYVELAGRVAAADRVEERLTELAEEEARILREPAAAPRLHA
jgi:tRNA-(ms[2]io[6]A)-hydroxylase